MGAIVRITVVVLLLFVMVTGVSLGSVTLVYTHWGASDAYRRALEREVAAFKTKYPESDIEVEIDLPGLGTVPYAERLAVLSAAGSMPDIMIVPSAAWPEFARQGLFLELEPLIMKDPEFDVSMLTEGILDQLRINGKLYNLPIGGFTPEGEQVALNMDLVEAAGLSRPDFTWTWDDYLTYARTLTRMDPQGRTVQWGDHIGRSVSSDSYSRLIASNGGSFVDPGDSWILKPVLDPSRLTIASPKVEAGFQFLLDLADVYHVTLSGGITVDQAWESGLLAIRHSSSGPARGLAASETVRTALAPSPMGDAGHHGIWPHVGNPHVYAIAATTKDPEAAWKFLRFLISEEEAVMARGIDGLATVAYRPLVDTYKEIIPENQIQWLEIGFRYLDMRPPAGNSLRSTIGAGGVFVEEEVSKAFNGEQSIRNALEVAQQRVAQWMIEEAARLQQ